MHTDAAGAPAWLELVPTRILHTFLVGLGLPPHVLHSCPPLCLQLGL